MIEEKLAQLHDLRVQKDAKKAEIAQINDQIEALNDKVVEEFEARKIKSMNIKGIGLFSLSISSYPRCIDKVLLYEWLESSGYGQETVLAYNASKFKGFYNELLDNKKPLPPGTEQFTKAQIKIKKGE